MKENIKNIEPGIGLGDLIFGMNMNQVKEVLGAPDETESQSSADEDLENIEIWHYDELELSISFTEEDEWKLYTISVNAKYYTLKNEVIMNMEINNVKDKLKEWEVMDLEYEDLSSAENPSHKLISSEEIGVYFWFENNQLSEIQWSPLFENECSIAWPEIPS